MATTVDCAPKSRPRTEALLASFCNQFLPRHKGTGRDQGANRTNDCLTISGASHAAER